MTGRNIVLFSDGTGNSSSKLQKTNVWRLYEALDLGDPARPNQREQIAYYDDGVGNSSFRLFAALAGIFGFGLARNVRELYTFFCRNYRQGDQIYAFGFSRGSYTIRLLVAMIAQFGPLRLTKEITDEKTGETKTVALTRTELDLQVRDVWRAFRRSFHTNWRASDFVVMVIRYLRAVFIAGKRRLLHKGFESEVEQSLNPATWIVEWTDYWRERRLRGKTGRQYSSQDWIDSHTDAQLDIRFVGVFDTVAAYGGPIVEITRAIDDWFWPLSMPDYRLNPRVKAACHALAIDDKRGSFDPLLWDEVFERANPDFNKDKPRLQQVWFAGMHADVGGGYSDESLSYVPLFWMLEHAEEAGLHFMPVIRARIEHYSNPHGFMHDSRRGFGAFYRYQPRYINAWIDRRNETQLAELRTLEPAPLPETGGGKKPPSFVKPATGVFRDQIIDGGRYRRQGFLVQPIHIHKDTFRRMRAQSDGYAPINLITGLAQDDGVRGSFPMPDGFDPQYKYLDQLGTRIRIRRFWYFVTMLLLTAFLAPHAWSTYQSYPLKGAPCGEFTSGSLAKGVCTSTSTFLPDTLGIFMGHVFAAPLIAFLMALALWFTVNRGMMQERVLGDLARNNWAHEASPRKGLHSPEPHSWPLTRQLYQLAWSLKRAKKVQNFLSYLKWSILPFLLGVAGWIIFLFIFLPWLFTSGLPWLGCQIVGDWLTNCRMM